MNFYSVVGELLSIRGKSAEMRADNRRACSALEADLTRSLESCRYFFDIL